MDRGLLSNVCADDAKLNLSWVTQDPGYNNDRIIPSSFEETGVNAIDGTATICPLQKLRLVV